MNLRQVKKHVTISEGNIKTGRIPSVSLPAVITCNREAPCTKGGCYMLPLLKMRPSVRLAYQKNLDTYNKKDGTYFESIDNWLKIKKPAFFRWHVCGDIPDGYYLAGMVHIAEKHPNIKFLAFTKKYDLVSNWDYPENLSIVISAWPGFELPQTELPIAYMQDGTEDRVKNAIQCHGNCETCGMCWELKNINKNVVFKKH
jgi:hypothetical protein